MGLPPDLFPSTFALGVCDYPEHVPWEQWRHYPERQRELGITYVRIAEFAWSRIEPREGRLQGAGFGVGANEGGSYPTSTAQVKLSPDGSALVLSG